MVGEFFGACLLGGQWTCLMGDGGDVAVAHGGDGDHGPVERHHVLHVHLGVEQLRAGAPRTRNAMSVRAGRVARIGVR